MKREVWLGGLAVGKYVLHTDDRNGVRLDMQCDEMVTADGLSGKIKMQTRTKENAR